MVVVNTSPLIALGRIGRLSVLKALYRRVVCPEAVVRELQDGARHTGFSLEFLKAPWLRVVADPPETTFRRDLGAGETAAVMYAAKHGARLVILDDLSARLYATSLRLNVTGTLGVLMAASESGVLPGGLSKAVQDLLDSGFYLSAELLKKCGIRR